MPASYTADNLPLLAGIQPVELHCNEATLSLARHVMKPGHLHSAFTHLPSANARCLKSRHTFVATTQQLYNHFIGQQNQYTQLKPPHNNSR